jgi:hypothetical protein
LEKAGCEHIKTLA